MDISPFFAGNGYFLFTSSNRVIFKRNPVKVVRREENGRSCGVSAGMGRGPVDTCSNNSLSTWRKGQLLCSCSTSCCRTVDLNSWVNSVAKFQGRLVTCAVI
jgi:hypothetical protein